MRFHLAALVTLLGGCSVGTYADSAATATCTTRERVVVRVADLTPERQAAFRDRGVVETEHGPCVFHGYERVSRSGIRIGVAE